MYRFPEKPPRVTDGLDDGAVPAASLSSGPEAKTCFFCGERADPKLPVRRVCAACAREIVIEGLRPGKRVEDLRVDLHALLARKAELTPEYLRTPAQEAIIRAARHSRWHWN
ncbi:MAG TPA: hypothetical protein VEQ10_17595 [Vicinamibacteria bacterium]|nr:hypothetical protein [Vicinamibacteria bacterium]